MSAFDKLQSYSASRGYTPVVDSVKYTSSSVFNTSTPIGAYLQSLHNHGFLMYVSTYEYEGHFLTHESYLKLPALTKSNCKVTTKHTELANVLLADGDQLIDSGAGSGKTTALVFKIIKDIVTGESKKPLVLPNGNTISTVKNIFVGTFLKTGAEELKDNLASWQRKLGYVDTSDNIHFGTLHAEFKRALNSMGVSTKIAKDGELKKYIKRAVDKMGVTRSGSVLTNEDYYIIEGIITYYRGRLDAKRYEHPSCADYTLMPIVLDKIVLDFAIQKQQDDVMDFEDLQELLYKFLYTTPNKAVQEFISNRYDFIYLDEFQDTSQIQYAILKTYARGRLKINKTRTDDGSLLYTGEERSGKFVVIGDDDQSIYGWRGSDVNIICKDFPLDFEPVISQLNINYRCPSNILNPVIPSITLNTNRYQKNLQSAVMGGDFSVQYSRSISGMIDLLLKNIEQDVQNGNSVAVICRTNFDGMIPAFMLEVSHKYDFSISSENMTLNSPLPKRLLAVTSLFTERTTFAVHNSLSLVTPRFVQYKVKELVQAIRNTDSFSTRLSVWTIPESDIEHSCPEIINFIIGVKSIVIDANGKLDKAQEINGLIYVYSYLKENIFNADSAYAQSARAYIEALLYLLRSKDFDSVNEFVNEVELYNERLTARIRRKAKISIATVHEFKGKERDCVYVWNDSEGVFPNTKTDVTNISQLEEERRVHYIACTRAKKKCMLMVLHGKDGMFLKEMSIKPEEKVLSGIVMNKHVGLVGTSINKVLDAMQVDIEVIEELPDIGEEE